MLLELLYYRDSGRIYTYYLAPLGHCVAGNETAFRALLATGNLTRQSAGYRVHPCPYDRKFQPLRYASAMIIPTWAVGIYQRK